MVSELARAHFVRPPPPTHGPAQDLFSIFTINDLPSEQNHYLFNGDLVDRGDYGCEVVLTILIFKLLYPNCVHINRGNHEDRAQNETAVCWTTGTELLCGRS